MLVAGIDVHVEGEGPETIVMVHGWPDTYRLWDRQVAALRDRYRCVRFTLPSFDASQPRKAFTLDLDRITHEATKEGEALSILMVDIDFFKKFNDKYGHLVGDQVLKLVAKTLRENVKGRDSVARWGGEEFAILLPQTRMEDAIKVGDYLRRLVASKKIMRKPQNEELGTITLSMGATLYLPGEPIDDFVNRADQALYRAKQEGRNRVLGNAPAAMPINLTQSGEVVPKTAAITVTGE